MCKEGERLFSNYSGYKELFDQGHQLVTRGLLNPKTFLDQMIKADYIYKVFAGLQGLHVSRIKEVLSESVIHDNAELRYLTLKLAQAYNDMLTACTTRCIDFYYVPSESWIDSHWEMYCKILKGLSLAEIESLDEHAWDLTLDNWEDNNRGGHYKQDFIRKKNNSVLSKNKKNKF